MVEIGGGGLRPWEPGFPDAAISLQIWRNPSPAHRSRHACWRWGMGGGAGDASGRLQGSRGTCHRRILRGSGSTSPSPLSPTGSFPLLHRRAGLTVHRFSWFYVAGRCSFRPPSAPVHAESTDPNYSDRTMSRGRSTPAPFPQHRRKQ
jgi:hypothetical protein